MNPHKRGPVHESIPMHSPYSTLFLTVRTSFLPPEASLLRPGPRRAWGTGVARRSPPTRGWHPGKKHFFWGPKDIRMLRTVEKMLGRLTGRKPCCRVHSKVPFLEGKQTSQCGLGKGRQSCCVPPRTASVLAELGLVGGRGGRTVPAA